MAHLTVEMSRTVADSLDAAGLCEALHQAMADASIFPLAGIRVRAYVADAFAMADNHPDNGFVAMTLSVGHGRSKPALASAGDKVFAAAKQHMSSWLAAPHFGLTLEIREIDKDLTWKANTIRPRLLADKGTED